MEHAVDIAYKYIEARCDYVFDVTTEGKQIPLGYVFDLFFDEPKIQGSCGDWRRTKHENMFAMLYPGLKTQVVFGTGKGGLEKYGCKRFIADFYEESSGYVYEINGSSHYRTKNKIRDLNKRLCLLEKYGIKMIEITNKKVEEVVRKRLIELYEEGRLNIAN